MDRIPLPLLYVTGFRHELSRAFFIAEKAYKYGLFRPPLQDPERKDRTVPDGFENGINFEDSKQLRSGWFLNGITFR